MCIFYDILYILEKITLLEKKGKNKKEYRLLYKSNYLV